MSQLQATDSELPLMRFKFNGFTLQYAGPFSVKFLYLLYFSLPAAASDIRNKRTRASTQWDRCPSVCSAHRSGNGQQAGRGMDIPQPSSLLYLCCSVCTHYGQMVSDSYSVSVIDNRKWLLTPDCTWLFLYGMWMVVIDLHHSHSTRFRVLFLLMCVVITTGSVVWIQAEQLM